MITHQISEDTFQDLINIKSGLFMPLNGFMGEGDFLSVLNDMTLADGKTVWTIPITLDVDAETWESCQMSGRLGLLFKDKECGEITVESKFLLKDSHLEKIFGTVDTNHPGVAKEKSRHPYRVGGKLSAFDGIMPTGTLLPSKTKAVFSANGWRTVAGFQTRNPIHNAHEHLQRIGLELCADVFTPKLQNKFIMHL